MADDEAFYRIYLQQELERRKDRNPRYSLRAFAKSLSIDNGQLSKIISGKSLLSVDLANNLSKKLRLVGEDREKFLISAADEQRCYLLYLVDPSLTECGSTEEVAGTEACGKKSKDRPKY